MNKDRVLDSLGRIDNDMIRDVETLREKKKKNTWMKWSAVAASICLVAMGAMGAMFLLGHGNQGTPVLEWSEDFPVEDYFKYNKEVNPEYAKFDMEIPYDTVRFFSDKREQMEKENVIPSMPDYPLYECNVCYNEDGSIFSVTHGWDQRGDNYSDLTITIGRQEVEQLQDCFYVEIDENGNIVPPSVTVTERDGIQIVAEGNENRDKTLTFQNDTAWYQIAGSWNDSYEAMVKLLDWVWEHPVDFEMFPMDQGSEISSASITDDPKIFDDQIPDFEALGYFPGENHLLLKDGEPYYFEGHYYKGIDADKVEDGNYLKEDGGEEIHWCVDAEPDFYDLQECLGDLSQLTKEHVVTALTEENHFSFLLDDCYIKVFCKDAEEAWIAVESLKE